jgi:hypothetical protein
MRKLALIVATLVGLASCGGKGSGSNQATTGEIVETKVSLDLPEPPTFTDPQPNPDGTHSVIEMRRKGVKYMEQTVKVKGYVVFKYDLAYCESIIGKDAFKADPSKCDRPHMYLGDEMNTSHDKALWVVEVPRNPREDEKKVLPKEELRDPAIWPPEPKYAMGDQVEVEGMWSTKSPKGCVNSDGLLVFKTMTIVTAAASLNL